MTTILGATSNRFAGMAEAAPLSKNQTNDRLTFYFGHMLPSADSVLLMLCDFLAVLGTSVLTLSFHKNYILEHYSTIQRLGNIPIKTKLI